MDTDASDIPPDLLEEALELGWSRAILARGLAAGMTRTNLRRMLGWGLPAEHMERKIDWHVRLHSGLHAREATDDDGEGFSELCRSSPIETGDWEITTEHEPNAFAQFRLQERLNLLLIADGPTLVASCGFSTRNVLVGGQRLSVRYGQALRVHRDYRRQGSGDQVRSLGWGIGCSRPSAVQYDIMRLGNFAVVGWWEKYFPDFFDDVPDQGAGKVPGLPVEVMQYPARSADDDRTIRPASLADIPRCAELINGTHQGLDLFRPYSEEFLANRLDEGFWGERPFWWSPVYCWDDYRVVEEGGRIVACGGLWDRGRDLRDRWRHRQTRWRRRHQDGQRCSL